MVEYYVITCPYCGEYLACKVGARTKTCTLCGRRFEVRKARILRKVRDGREASIIIRYLKAKKAGISEQLYGKGGSEHHV
ncbi:MAG: hypothetical protein DRN15_00945 [Thermoprotei archaeon]|nr:MAG: hypothetical protein DRM97_03780 [Thermoprotei archaeon]RLF25252.1 MAG: hypothetical protein DRN15_00945 [Thermoprotei archaeon]